MKVFFYASKIERSESISQGKRGGCPTIGPSLDMPIFEVLELGEGGKVPSFLLLLLLFSLSFLLPPSSEQLDGQIIISLPSPLLTSKGSPLGDRRRASFLSPPLSSSLSPSSAAAAAASPSLFYLFLYIRDPRFPT